MKKMFDFELLEVEKKEGLNCAKFRLIEGGSTKYYFVNYSAKNDKMRFYLAMNKALIGVCARAELLFVFSEVSKFPCSRFVATIAESARFKGGDRELVLITEAFKAFDLPMWSGEMA